MKGRLKDPVKEGLWRFFANALVGVFTGSREKRIERDTGPSMSGKRWKKRKSRLKTAKASRRRNRR